MEDREAVTIEEIDKITLLINKSKDTYMGINNLNFNQEITFYEFDL